MTKRFFSKDDQEDRKIAEEYIGRTGLFYGEEHMTPEQCIDSRINFINDLMKECGEFFKKAYDLHKQHDVKVWFHIEGV